MPIMFSVFESATAVLLGSQNAMHMSKTLHAYSLLEEICISSL